MLLIWWKWLQGKSTFTHTDIDRPPAELRPRREGKPGSEAGAWKLDMGGYKYSINIRYFGHGLPPWVHKAKSADTENATQS